MVKIILKYTVKYDNKKVKVLEKVRVEEVNKIHDIKNHNLS